MSKTVKKAMRVMMVGLVAMMGAEAEAHTKYYPPLKPFYCPPSVCVGGHVRGEEDKLDSSDIEYGEFLMEHVIGELLCDGRIKKNIELPTMRVRKRIEDIGLLSVTEKDGTEKKIEIDTIVAIFPDTFGDIVACPDSISLPSDSLIRKFSLTGKTFAEGVSGDCDLLEGDKGSCVETDLTSTITCTLPSQFGLVPFPPPIKRPTLGTLYECTK